MFELISKYKPAGDQPEAIKELVDKYNLQNSANIEVKVITERRAISLEKFLQNSIVIK